MTPRRYLQVDVFADRPGAGNALGVVLDAEGLDGAAMQAIAGWTNLSEGEVWIGGQVQPVIRGSLTW
ncbi:PhzF family phenazine biosynthesis protein [Pseudoxanthomonas putridarboris]|uniref:PhzF family phenazine biosynthesis protein n=1 Tax=Pseudoxanthomonas putridarboris TaxID=752605 RepID=UPI003CE522F7